MRNDGMEFMNIKWKKSYFGVTGKIKKGVWRIYIEQREKLDNEEQWAVFLVHKNSTRDLGFDFMTKKCAMALAKKLYIQLGDE